MRKVSLLVIGLISGLLSTGIGQSHALNPAIECNHARSAYAGPLRLDNGHTAWLWLDVPDTTTGTAPMRLFALQSAPQITLIAPTGIEADTCPPLAGIIDYPPALVDGVFAADGSFTTEFAWWVCPSCVECFVNFSETLQISAVPDGDGWRVKAAVIRYLQERPDDAEVIYQGSGHLSPVEPGLPAPVYRCDADGLCRFDFPLGE